MLQTYYELREKQYISGNVGTSITEKYDCYLGSPDRRDERVGIERARRLKRKWWNMGTSTLENDP